MLEKTEYTPEDLLTMPDGDRYELVDGQLVEYDVSGLASLIGNTVGRLLANYVGEHDLGEVFDSTCTYQCFPDDPNRVRKPDVSFIARGRVTLEQLERGHVRVAPDLAVEVVSPNDEFELLDRKIGEYLTAGVRLVWIIVPHTRAVWIHRPDGSANRLAQSGKLSGEDILPGFACPVADLFPRHDD